MKGREYYIKLQDGLKVTVSEEIYHEYYRAWWREKNRKRACTKKECPYEVLSQLNSDIICLSSEQLVEDIVEDKLLLETLMEALYALNADELSLINALYYEDKTESEFASEIGISQQAINKRKTKLLDKIKKNIIN